MELTRRTNGRLALLATPLVTASLAVAFALSAGGTSEPRSSGAAASTAGVSTDAHLQPAGAPTAAVQQAPDPVTITVTPTAICPGKRTTIKATVGGTFKPGTPPMKVVGTAWDIRIYDQEGDLVGPQILLNSGRSRTLEFEWGSRVPGVYVLFADVAGAPGSAGSAMTWFVILPEYACQGKPPPPPGPTPTPKPTTPTPKPTPPASPTPKPTTTTP